MSEPAPSPARKICFDVTDIVSYATGNLRVSGIQRVQLNLISGIARNNPGANIFCTFFHPTLLKMVSFRPQEVLVDSEFDATSILHRLGLSSHSLIPKQEIRKYLSKFHNKSLRALKKLEIYFYAVFFRSRLQKLGFKKAENRRQVAAAQIEETHLAGEDSYVILGSNWAFKEVIHFCKQHSARGGDVVQMVYDLIPYVRPEYCTPGLQKHFKDWLTDLSSYVNRYICISEFTTRDLRNFLGPKAENKSIKVITLAHEFDGYARYSQPVTPSSEINDLLHQPFVLCVGTLEVRKNGVALLQAWLRLIEKLGQKTPTLIFVGKPGWRNQEFNKTLHSNQLAHFVKIIHLPSDSDLASLYQNCLFTIYPSLYEGWGLPVGEAAWFGKACITSNATSLPEVCGDLAIYVDPTNIDDIAEKAEKHILNPGLITAKENAIKESKLRTWLDVSNDIYEFIESQAATNNSPVDHPVRMQNFTNHE